MNWGSLFGDPALPQGGVLGEPVAADPQHDAKLAMAAQLLAGGGYSTQRRGAPEIFGAALMAGQQARMQAQQFNQQAREAQQMGEYRQAQIAHLKATPPVTEPASVKEYQYAKANGYQGSYQDWTTISGQTSRPSAVQEWEVYNKMPPAEQKRYLEMKRAMGFKVDTVQGVPTVINQGAAGQPATTQALSTLPGEIAAGGAIAQGKAQGSAQGEATGKAAGGIQAKGIGANAVLQTLDIAEPLIDISTGSATGAAVDAVTRFFGHATDGAKANTQLKILQAGLMTNMPRMEGPQSDADVRLYREAAGQIGDATIPAEQKKAAIGTIRQIQQKYQENAGVAARAPGGASAGPAVGAIDGGYRFKGGNPADPNSWEKL